MTAAPTRAIRIAILAMGGEGGGVLADWLVSMAEGNGYVAQLTSVPGVAQRTGATNYYIELIPAENVPAGGAPVLALTPFPGDIDVVIASELMEAGRAIQRGLVTPDRTTLVTSTARAFAISERVALGDGRADADKLIEASRLAAHRLVALDMAEIAEKAGSVISASMLGAVAGAGALPFARAAYEGAIERGGIGVAASKRAFGAAFEAAQTVDGGDASQTRAEPAPAPEKSSVSPVVTKLQSDLCASLPAAAHDFAREGVARCFDYQDSAYARLYVERLQRIAGVDRASGDGSARLTAETARWLALAMTYEDTIRVAELKIRSSRMDRVRKEVRLGEGQLLQVAEFLHPRLQEIAESVPAPLGRFLERNWLARKLIGAMTASGKIVDTTSVRGYLLLAAVASLKPRRRQSMRFGEESRSIETWLADVAAMAPKSYEMALEIAECRRLVKGYGDTHARGRRSYETILAWAKSAPSTADAAAHVGMLRTAALEDESGEKLGKLMQLMAPAGSSATASPVQA